MRLVVQPLPSQRRLPVPGGREQQDDFRLALVEHPRQARALDYVLVSGSIRDRVKKASIHADVMGSDHCPVSIEIDL